MLAETFELRMGRQVFEVRVAAGRCTTAEGRPGAPAAALTMDVATLRSLLRRELSPAEALAGGRVELQGDPEALERFVAIFALPVSARAAS